METVSQTVLALVFGTGPRPRTAEESAAGQTSGGGSSTMPRPSARVSSSRRSPVSTTSRSTRPTQLRSTTSATSATPASIRSPAASIRRCTAGGSGRCASSPVSAPPKRRTSGSGTCSTTGRPACRRHSTCRLSWATTRTTRGREAGSNAVQELAFTLADGFAYVDAAIERGLDVDEFAPRLSFFFNAHIDFFEEIAKYRAARRIWARELKERFGAKNPRSWLLRIAPAVEHKRVGRVRAVRARRDGAAVEQLLARLKSEAAGDRNLMPTIV